MSIHVYTHRDADETRPGNSGSWNTIVASPENDENQQTIGEGGVYQVDLTALILRGPRIHELVSILV